MCNKIRLLRADEIDVRVAQAKNTAKSKGCSLLLYKDARCDMNILDETFGAMNWQRRHTRENANCIVSIWDDEKKQWIDKEDTGTESNTEKEKGLASDSFKRACVNVGIGRELYTAPFIWVKGEDTDIYDTGRKDKFGNAVYAVNDNFKVDKITYNDRREIEELIISNKNGKAVFSRELVKPSTDYRQMFIDCCKMFDKDLTEMSKKYKLTKKSTNEDFGNALVMLNAELQNEERTKQ